MNTSNFDLVQSILYVLYLLVGSAATYVYNAKFKHAKKQDQLTADNDKFQSDMKTALEVAKNKVVPLAIDSTLGSTDKRKLAIQRVSDGLDKLGINLPVDVISEITERAYQIYKANGGDIHKLDLSSAEQAQPTVQSDQQQVQQNPTVEPAQSAPINPYAKGDVNND